MYSSFLTRNNENHLQTTYHLVELAQHLTKLEFKKERTLIKKRMHGYQSQLDDYKRLQQVMFILCVILT